MFTSCTDDKQAWLLLQRQHKTRQSRLTMGRLIRQYFHVYHEFKITGNRRLRFKARSFFYLCIMASDSKPPAGYTDISVGVNSWLAAHAWLSRAPHFPRGVVAGAGAGAGVAGDDDVIIYTSSCATVHHSNSERSQCQFPCWLFLCLQKDRLSFRLYKSCNRTDIFCFCKSVNNNSHAVCRHLHDTNAKCVLFPLCHYGLHSVVKGELDCDDLNAGGNIFTSIAEDNFTNALYSLNTSNEHVQHHV